MKLETVQLFDYVGQSGSSLLFPALLKKEQYVQIERWDSVGWLLNVVIIGINGTLYLSLTFY